MSGIKIGNRTEKIRRPGVEHLTAAAEVERAGISEALVETALGLVVAIPAVWIYNYFTGRLEYFNVEMDNSSSELVDYFIKKTA